MGVSAMHAGPSTIAASRSTFTAWGCRSIPAKRWSCPTHRACPEWWISGSLGPVMMGPLLSALSISSYSIKSYASTGAAFVGTKCAAPTTATRAAWSIFIWLYKRSCGPSAGAATISGITPCASTRRICCFDCRTTNASTAYAPAAIAATIADITTAVLRYSTADSTTSGEPVRSSACKSSNNTSTYKVTLVFSIC